MEINETGYCEKYLMKIVRYCNLLKATNNNKNNDVLIQSNDRVEQSKHHYVINALCERMCVCAFFVSEVNKSIKIRKFFMIVLYYGALLNQKEKCRKNDIERHIIS